MSMRVAMNLLWCRPGVGGSEEYLTRQLAGIAAIGHPNRHQTRLPMSGYRPTPRTPEKSAPMKNE